MDRVESALRDGFAALERHLQGPAGAPVDRLEEVVELLEAAIDHLVSIERRMDALEAQLAPPPPPPATATRARRTRKQTQPDS
jgi:hypothetical protein